MYWSRKKSDQWNAQKATFNGAPEHILSQNELDVSGELFSFQTLSDDG